VAKVKNASAKDYTGVVEARAGEVVEVSDEQAAYLLSPDCPGQFVPADEKKAPKGSK
jgi:hypothetical protein